MFYFNHICLSGRVSVCCYPIIVKTAEPIGTKICVGPHMAAGKVHEESKFQRIASNKIKILLNLKIHEIFIKPQTF